MLRELSGRPGTREALLDGLAKTGYGVEQLAEAANVIEAQDSDLYDVLAYVAFNLAPVTRADRVASREERAFEGRDYRQREFLRFVLDHYVDRGVSELDTAKLPQLIELKHHTLGDATAELGPAQAIRDVFIGFQRHLY